MSEQVSPELLAKRRASLERIGKIAYWLDDAFRIPVINKRIGIDGITGFVPFLGDFVGFALSSMVIGEALRVGAPKPLLMRMGANIGIDFLVGLVPLLGDWFDIYFKANRRNQKLLQRWLDDVTGAGQHDRARTGPGAMMIVISLGLGLIVATGLWRAVFGA